MCNLRYGLLIFCFGKIFAVDIDVALATKNRIDSFKQVVENLNQATVASDIHLYVLDGNSHNEVNAFLSDNKWRFKTVNIWREDDVAELALCRKKWAALYNFLFKKGNSPLMTYWSDDIFIMEPTMLEKVASRLWQADDTVAASLFFYKVPGKDGAIPRVSVSETGLIGIWFGLVKRAAFEKVGGLDENYKFFCADNDLTNKLYYVGNFKTILNTDCIIDHRHIGLWKNEFAIPMSYAADREIYFQRWNKQLKTQFVTSCVAKIYPLDTKIKIVKRRLTKV